MKLTLEKEFEEYKALHKYSVLKAKIMKYYMDLEEGQINLPDFLRETPENKADRDISELLMFHRDKFNELYERAWEEVRERLD